ncbi:hypothetical protein CVT25_004326 [Psilocybe cyanescens]|uniref:Protein S-acyltransferase n=1 Tax=Psilocybe cyanescens TaxID=93625 RepID=A0A409XQ20_PSICY|nr:hypothetical protein CVT25_004326 [Psilocybe cyanescens]
MAPRRSPGPLLTFSSVELQSVESSIVFNPQTIDNEKDNKRWYHYLPLCGTVFLLLAPQPSWLYVLVDFHLQTLHQPVIFFIHLSMSYTLTFLAFSSLIVCLARDPGPANAPPSRVENANGEEDEMDLTEALMPDRDFSAPDRWLAFKALWYAFNHPFVVHEFTPVHELGLAFAGAVFTLVVGSFAAYHVYLIFTNQTTVENIAPFMLLRYLPPLPRSGHSLSDPPLEPELSSIQRRIVRAAHGQILIYDLGWRKNLEQVFGWNGKYGWLFRFWCGGASPGDGKHFPRNPRSDEMLAKLANELVKADLNT